MSPKSECQLLFSSFLCASDNFIYSAPLSVLQIKMVGKIFGIENAFSVCKNVVKDT